MSGAAETGGAELAADVGGTHARIALVERDGTRFTLSRFRKYRCAEFDGLAEIVSQYCLETGCAAPAVLGAAVAGAVSDGEIIARNTPWTYGFEKLADRFPGLRLLALNDYHAVAVGTQLLGQADALSLTPGLPTRNGLAIAIGLGTGLGAAIRHGAGDDLRVFPTELGQTRLGAYSGLHLEVLRMLAEPNGFVRVERVLSGPGIAATYHAVRTVLGLSAPPLAPSEVVARAQGADEAARAAVQIVVCVLANLLGNLAVMLRPDGGIYLSGGVTPHLEPFLRAPPFLTALEANDVMRDRIRSIPILVVRRDDVGILGAAAWMQQRTRKVGVETI